MRPSTILPLALAAFLVLAEARAEEPVSLERTLVRAAPDVLKRCREKGYKNVGVLKFLGHKDGDAALSDSLGTLNRTVARQLELGMILANDRKDPIGILDSPSDAAAKIPGANHLSKDGRLKLFAAKYPLAWGTESVTPDAFITGIVGVGKDLKTLTIKLLAFDPTSNKLEPFGEDLVAANDPRKLSEMGESFTRGAFDDGKVEPKEQEKRNRETLAKAVQVKAQTVENPARDAAAPIALEVLYDGKVAPVEIREGKAFVAEPNEGQKVAFRLKRNVEKGRFSCVLKVNGENTLFRQKLPDANCRKWLLFPEDKAGILVAGFQKTDDKTEEFRVLPKAESKAREIDYGSDVGTITLTVFGERKDGPPAGDNSRETLDTQALENAKPPETKPKDFDVLTAQLLQEAERGLIAEGNTVAGKIAVVKFKSDPNPLMSLTITYYKK